MCANLLGAFKGWTAVTTLLFICQVIKGQNTCGGFHDVSRLDFATGTFNSPNYPGDYSPRSDCIWLVYGPSIRTISFTILSLDAESEAGQCVDFLEVRAGSAKALELYKGCSLPGNLTVETPNRWLWVRFRSDEAISGKGFFAIWRTTNNLGNTSYSKNPVPECPSTRFTCLNKECISYAWTCDGFNDCGCTEWGCDENPCLKSVLTNPIRLAIGVSAGIVITIFAIVVTMWSECINPWPPFKKKPPEPPKKK